jgi:putative acetyltransferase
MKIKQAQTPDEIDEARRLFREYEAFLSVDLCFQGFEEELAGLPGKYAPPSGALLIALTRETVAGCVALRALGDDVCEMKRLFVRPEYRSTGLGKRLAREVVDVARGLGYSLMRLDTLDRLTEAMRLYESLGFRKTEPYYENPLHGVVYWELDLKEERTGQPTSPPYSEPAARSPQG